MDNHSNAKTLTEAFEDRDQTLPSTCSSRPSESYRPKPSAKVRDLIGRLGLRYRPTNAADLGAHAASLALLAEDVAEVPADLLERAIAEHVASSPWMPKAADLIRIAQDIERETRAKLPERTGRSYAHDLVALYNGQRTRDDVEWYVDHTGAVKCGDIHDGTMRIHQAGWKPEPGEIEEINARIAKLVAQGMTQDEFNRLVDRGRA